MELSNHIDDREMLYRAIKRSKPDWLVDGKLTSAIYKDNGNSVDRDAGRKEDVIIDFMRNGKLYPRVKAVVKISAGDCYSCGTRLTADPSEGNPYHANIWLDDEDINIQNLMALELRDKSKMVFYDEDMEWT